MSLVCYAYEYVLVDNDTIRAGGGGGGGIGEEAGEERGETGREQRGTG